MSTIEEKNINEQHNQDYEIDTLTNDKLLKDHSYDGIRELDNDLPPWWKYLFYISLIFGVVYLVRLFAFQAPDLIQEKEYQKEMAKASETQQQANTTSIALLTDESSLNNGQETYSKSCAACHGQDGGGLVGSNLTDDHWLHGNTFDDLYKVVSEGVTGTSMLAYESQLSPTKRAEVVSYVMEKLHGTTPANPKAPEGEEMKWSLE